MPRNSRISSKDYEPKRSNPITLGDDSNIENDLKPFKIDSKNTILELSESELKVRGSIDASAITVDGASVQTGAIELNKLSDVTYDSGDLTITDLDKIVSGDLLFDSSGDITFDTAGDSVFFDNASTTFGQISTSSASTLAIVSSTNYTLLLRSLGTGDVTLDSSGDIIIDSADGNFLAKKNGTEFSAANSSYAGMILGYTMVGADVADDSYTLVTSYLCFQDSGGTEIASIFKTPPSENVEIEVELYFSCGSGASDLFLTLSNHAIFGANSLNHPEQHEKVVITPARGWGGTITQKFYLNANHLEAVGSSNTIYIAAKTDSISGTPVIKWGGDTSGDYTNLVMKATALPATIVEGS